jgi:hypothetical protein
MTFASRGSRGSFSGLPATAESVAEHRARLAREQEHAQQRRKEALSGQVSITNTPSERIVIWEQLHGLPLPSSPNHKLLEVIAAATDLQIGQVQEVQKLREVHRRENFSQPGVTSSRSIDTG